MFTCAYCGTQFLEHKPNCSNCGAALKADSNPARESSGQKSAFTMIYKVCDQYQDNPSIYFDDSIDPTRMKNALSNLNIPENERVIMLYDDTVFNINNKVGFAICEQGIYWKNDWSVDTKRNHLPWLAFAEREIVRDGYHISLGKGDRIGMAGCGSDEIREKVIAMLKEIQALLRR